jgi:hypothetical protein
VSLRRVLGAVGAIAASVVLVVLVALAVVGAEDPLEACLELGGQPLLEPHGLTDELKLEECLMPAAPR